MSQIEPSEKPKKKIGRIFINRDLCIGAASCIAVAPGVFQLDGENKAVVIDENGADQQTIMLAAQSCPTRAIFLYDEEGKQIYP
ncbi:MAG: ferredoxin [Patescibacteria group bacterium]